MAPIIKWQPHSLSAFQESLKPGVTNFQPLRRDLLPPAKCVVSQMCMRLRGGRHRATPGRQMIFHTSDLHMQDHRHTLCSSSHPPPCLPAFLPAHPHPNAPFYFPHPLFHVFFPPHAHTYAQSNPQAPFHPPAFPPVSPQSLALLSLRCSAAPAHTPSWHSLVLTRLSCSLSPNAQCCNQAVPCSVQSCVCCPVRHTSAVSGPEQVQHVSGLKMNMLGASLFSELTPWYHSPQGDWSVV